MSIGDAVIASDERGRITLMNSVAENLTGWKRQEAEGQPVDKVFHIVNEETRALVESPVEKVLRTGAIVGLGESHRFDRQATAGKLRSTTAARRFATRRTRYSAWCWCFAISANGGRQEIQIDKWQRIFQQAGFGVAILVNDGKTILEVNRSVRPHARI